MIGIRKLDFSEVAGFALVAVFLFIALFGTLLAPYEFDQTRFGDSLFGTLVPPNEVNILGTTASGLDVYSRLLLGSQTALSVVVLSVLLASIVGVSLGVVAGYAGGAIDRVLSIVADSLFAIPSLLIALVVSFSLSGGAAGPYTSIAAAVVAEGLTFGARYFRIVRSEVIVVAGSRYVEAARVSGISKSRLLLRHVLPNSLRTTPVVMTQNGADAILTLAGLGFLGVGIGANSGAEWGYDLSNAMSDLTSGIWWTSLFPAIAVAIAVVGLTLSGEAYAERLEGNSSIGN